jgi:hypothetical protein
LQTDLLSAPRPDHIDAEQKISGNLRMSLFSAAASTIVPRFAGCCRMLALLIEKNISLFPFFNLVPSVSLLRFT